MSKTFRKKYSSNKNKGKNNKSRKIKGGNAINYIILVGLMIAYIKLLKTNNNLKNIDKPFYFNDNTMFIHKDFYNEIPENLKLRFSLPFPSHYYTATIDENINCKTFETDITKILEQNHLCKNE